jgi:hypothetical protein
MDENRAKSKTGVIVEDNPVEYEAALRTETIKLFAFYAKRKEDLAAQEQRIQ